jgi:pyrroline-5-carboxylate reductase
MTTTVFIGCGSITSSLVAGLNRAKYKTRLVVYDRNPEKPKKLRREFGIEVTRSLSQALSQADLLIVAVRPDNVAGLLREIRTLASEVIKQREKAKRSRVLTVCSLAAGIPLKQLRAAVPTNCHWVRAMPSPTSHSGCGLTALCFDSKFPRFQRAVIVSLFEALGPVIKIPERQFDAFTVTYSSSHGYHALAALANAGEKAGLSRKTALLAASHALADGIFVWKKGDLSLDGLIREAETPGGIAASVIQEMNRHGYARIFEKGLSAGILRARRNAGVIYR